MAVNMGAAAGSAAGRGFQNTFNFMQDAMRMKEEAEYLKEQRAIETDQRKATAKVSEMMAKGPQETAIPSDTQQSAMLAEQTDDPNAALDLTTADDDRFNALEEKLYAETGRTKMVAKDWDRFEQEFGASLGAINDPELISKLKDYPNALRQRGFTSRLGKAAVLLEAGDVQGAQDSLETAFSYMNDGTITRTVVTKDKDGNPVIMANTASEETGKPLGNPVVFNAEVISKMARRAEKGADTWDDMIEQRKVRIDEVEAATDRFTAAADATAGTGGAWNTASSFRAGAAAQKQIESVIENAGDMDLQDAFANNQAEFTAMVTQIANSTQNNNIAEVVTFVQPVIEARERAKAAGEPLPVLTHDPQYGMFVMFPRSGKRPMPYREWRATQQ